MPNPESVLPKLLVVDGSPMMHRIMELTFAPEGIQVITESDGDQAIALLPIVRPDIVIADHALAGKSGYEVAAFVRNHPELSGVPVLLLASPFEPLDRARAEASGVAGEISKPFEPVQLVARVRELLARAAEQTASRRSLRSSDESVPGDARASALKLVEPAVPAPRGALDDYFDRLDAALERLDDQIAAREEAPAVSVPDSDRRGDDDPRVPTLDKLLGSEESPRGAVLIDHPLRGVYATLDAPDTGHAASAASGGPASPDPAPAPAQAPGSELGALVDALEALRRRESKVEMPTPASPTAETPATDSTVPLSEAVLDEITRRVLERLAPGAVSQVAIEVVTKVAERLLREEIARLSRPTTMS